MNDDPWPIDERVVEYIALHCANIGATREAQLEKAVGETLTAFPEAVIGADPFIGNPAPGGQRGGRQA